MWVSGRHLAAAALALAASLAPRPASAWVETQIASDATTVDVERDGSAVVTHDLSLKVRGGPLLGFDLEGVDLDAQPLPDATVVETRDAGPAGTPLPLLVERRDDGTLRLEIDGKGVRRGTYLFHVSYRTQLLQRDLLTLEGAQVALRWVGPRYADGVDSARVTFRLPSAPEAPALAEIDRDRAALGVAEDPGGVFLASLRRGSDKDELEVVRPHVAKGEPVVWRVRSSARAFDAFAPPAPSGAVAATEVAGEERLGQGAWAAIAVLVGLLYAAVVFGKWRVVERAAALRAATPRALLPLSPVLRSLVAGSGLGAALALAALLDEPTWAAACLALATLSAAVIAPRAGGAPRGPGRWLALSEAEAFAPPAEPLPGAWLDAGTLRGFVPFTLGLIAFVAAAALILPRSPYHALLVLLASACLVPVFCTGRLGELPADAATAPRHLLGWLSRELASDAALKVVPWVRLPTGSAVPDELRLLVMPRKARRGLTSIEVAVEYGHGPGGSLALPCVLVRAGDGSDAHGALPRSVSWTRGRKPEERVAVIRPKLPTRSMTLALARRLAALCTDDGQASSASSSGGKAARTSKAARTRSPAQAMRLACSA